MNFIKSIFAVSLAMGMLSPSEALSASYVSEVWVADRGDGTYRNPVIYADYSDPDVIRVGDDFYMTASSFQAAPGLPILHSKDLVNWSIVNYALREFLLLISTARRVMARESGLLPSDIMKENTTSSGGSGFRHIYGEK